MMFQSKKIAALEHRIYNLEKAYNNIRQIILSSAQPEVMVLFEPDKELTAAVKGKKLN